MKNVLFLIFVQFSSFAFANNFRDSCVTVDKDGAEIRCKDADAIRRCFLIINAIFLNRRLALFKTDGMLSVFYKENNGKEIEMKPIRHLDSMEFYNKQYYKLIGILRTIG